MGWGSKLVKAVSTPVRVVSNAVSKPVESVTKAVSKPVESVTEAVGKGVGQVGETINKATGTNLGTALTALPGLAIDKAIKGTPYQESLGIPTEIQGSAPTTTAGVEASEEAVMEEGNKKKKLKKTSKIGTTELQTTSTVGATTAAKLGV